MTHLKSVHERKKHYKCDVCDKAYSEKGVLTRHVNHIHKGIKLKCKICDQDFSEKGKLSIHIATIHEGKKSISVIFVIKLLAWAGTLRLTSERFMKWLKITNVSSVTKILAINLTLRYTSELFMKD